MADVENKPSVKLFRDASMDSHCVKGLVSGANVLFRFPVPENQSPQKKTSDNLFQTSLHPKYLIIAKVTLFTISDYTRFTYKF